MKYLPVSDQLIADILSSHSELFSGLNPTPFLSCFPCVPDVSLAAVSVPIAFYVPFMFYVPRWNNQTE